MGIFNFTLLVLSIFYLVLSIILFIKFYKLSTENLKIKVTFGFYISLLFASLVRGTTFILISINSEKSDFNLGNVIIYLLFSAPDMINVCVYIFLVWHFFSNFILSHINLAEDIYLFLENDEPKIQKKTYYILIISISLYTTAFITLCILTALSIMNNSTLPVINSYFNVCTPGVCLAYYIFLLIKFSGRPYISNKLKSQSNRIYFTTIIWSLARILVGIGGFIESRSLIETAIELLNDKNEDNSFYFSLAFVGFFALTEFLPAFLAIDGTLMRSYIKQDKILPKKIEHIYDKMSDEYMVYDNCSSTKEGKDGAKVISDDFVIGVKDFNILNVIEEKTKYSFGSIHKGAFRNKTVICRILNFERLSRYDLEELSKDMDEIL